MRVKTNFSTPVTIEQCIIVINFVVLKNAALPKMYMLNLFSF